MQSTYKLSRQASINAICSYFIEHQISSTQILSIHLTQIIEKINHDPKVYNSMDDAQHRIDIFKAALAAYNRISDYVIRIPKNIDWNLFNTKENSMFDNENKHSPSLMRTDSLSPSLENKHEDPFACANPSDYAMSDLNRVTLSYDHLANASKENQIMSQKISRILASKAAIACDAIIFGAGDTGTTLWLEKYKAHHEMTHQFLSEEKIPHVLIIADNFGSWKHDYTLAQTQSSLERSTAYKNPRDFLPTEYYRTNPQANARHVFQANQVCLSATEAPIVNLKLIKIEKRENHPEWEITNRPYRALVQFPDGQRKRIYTDMIDVCTGLGAPNLKIDEKIIPSETAKKLNQFDHQRGFTPIVDGNQFVLSDSEEKKQYKTIVVYGGGGTASACYRKSFFGDDIRTHNRPFTAEHQKNTVYWVYKDFIGTGKLAMTALRTAEQRNEVFKGELTGITVMPCGQLLLAFDIVKPDGSQTSLHIACDQLVYSIGQNDIAAKKVCEEVSEDLQFHYDSAGMVLYVSTPDKKINYFGAAAVSFRKIEFNQRTLQWLNTQNIGGDVGAGSMPPTRAQVKRHLTLEYGIKPKSVNTNMDTTCLIEEFMLDAKIDNTVIASFIHDLLLARKEDTYGCSRVTLEQLLKKHHLDQLFNIFGHSHLVSKATSQSLSPTAMLKLIKDKETRQSQCIQDDMNLQSPDLYLSSVKNKIFTFFENDEVKSELKQNSANCTSFTAEDIRPLGFDGTFFARQETSAEQTYKRLVRSLLTLSSGVVGGILAINSGPLVLVAVAAGAVCGYVVPDVADRMTESCRKPKVA